MRNRLGIIPKLDEINIFCELAEEYDAFFEYNDFFLPGILDDGDELKRRIGIIKGLGRDTSSDTLHGVFFDINVASDDPEIVRVSDKRIRSSMDIASELGVKGVVLHTNFIANFRMESYYDNWVKRNRDYYAGLLEDYGDLEVYVENMFDMDHILLSRLAEAMKDETSFGVCLDYAHARVFGNDPDLFVKNLHSYVKHMHINDNYGVSDDHLSIGEGNLDWEEFHRLMDRYGLDREDISILLEVSGYERSRTSLEVLGTKH